MRSKYVDYNYFQTFGDTFSLPSRTWTRIMDIWEDAETHIGLLIQDGHSSLWWENWSMEGFLCPYATNVFTTSSKKHSN